MHAADTGAAQQNSPTFRPRKKKRQEKKRQRAKRQSGDAAADVGSYVPNASIHLGIREI